MIKNKIFYFLFLVLVFPSVSNAQQFTMVKSLLTSFGGLINQTIRILLGLSLVFFFWGISQFILHSGEQKARDEGKKKMLWGVIAIFIFVSIGGIIALLGRTFGVSGVSLPTP